VELDARDPTVRMTLPLSKVLYGLQAEDTSKKYLYISEIGSGTASVAQRVLHVPTSTVCVRKVPRKNLGNNPSDATDEFGILEKVYGPTFFSSIPT
jgi:hypothetical protein